MGPIPDCDWQWWVALSLTPTPSKHSCEGTGECGTGEAVAEVAAAMIGIFPCRSRVMHHLVSAAVTPAALQAARQKCREETGKSKDFLQRRYSYRLLISQHHTSLPL